jgi:hypothetical protein
MFAVEATLREVSTISVKLVNNCMSDEPDCARRQITDIRTIAEDVGFHGTRSTHYDDEWVYTQTIIYEDKMKSGEDVLAFQIVSENYAEDDRGRYEIYDYGYHYNTIASDFYQNTTPVISTDEFDYAKDEWIERVDEKRVKMFENDVKERDSEQDTTLNDF